MDIVEAILGLPCWHVSAGGSSAPSFVLVLGRKERRAVPLRNPAQPEAFRLNRGAVELLVWCSWRLQDDRAVFASSDQNTGWVEELRKLCGQSVTSVECSPPAWDLQISFSGGSTLVVFCDHVDEESSMAQNWELYVPGRVIRTGPGTTWEEEADGGEGGEGGVPPREAANTE